jgi:hypothetical protein
MNKAVGLLLFVVACHKHEAAQTSSTTTTTTPAPTETTVVAATAPSETAAPTASASAQTTNNDPHIAREEALRQAAEIGILGLLSADGGSPMAPWGREDSLSKGNVFGDPVGDSFGAGGLGLKGTGSDSLGGDGRGEGIGIGHIGGGHGTGGGGTGYGSGSGGLGGARHTTSTPRLRQGATTVNGRLAPEVIQRIARQNFGRFRLCYETGLRSDPKLAGTVVTKFVIGADGSVTSSARDNATTMPDATVVSCVTRGFSNLSFPQPEGGIVVVTYPLIFEPGDSP